MAEMYPYHYQDNLTKNDKPTFHSFNYSNIDRKSSLIYGSFSIPHCKKKKKGGEDYHIAEDHLLVVTDGVGGWNQVGVDPSEFAKELCKKYSYLISAFRNPINH